MWRLTGQVRRHAWGSRHVIAELQGRPVPAPEAEAELWFGAHPAAPSTVDHGVLLTDLLGGVRLPFLLKLLAAEDPLSLQAHPDAVRAQARFKAGDPNYVDPYHKPELLVAVDRFEALCGFREPTKTAQWLTQLGVLPGLAAVLGGPGGESERLRAAVTMLLDWSATDRAAAVSAVATVDELTRRLAVRYPDDPGVLVALLLNRVRLKPGEAIWMPAGNLHSYLRGTGVEIMAASDNVLRGGLTPKRVDLAELLEVICFEVLTEPVVTAVPVTPGVVTWPVPVPDFALHRALVNDSTAVVGVPSPRIAFCLAGEVTVDDGAGAVHLHRGQAAFGAPTSHPLTVSGRGEAYVATPGESCPAELLVA